MRKLSLTIFILLTACSHASSRRLSSDDGLPWTRVHGVETAMVNDELVVVRVDPRTAPLELLNPPETRGAGVASVAAREKLAVAVNASMFQADYVTSIGYMRNFGYVNNGHVSSKLRGFLLFHPKQAGLPPAKVGTADDLPLYDTVIQTHRMWDPQEGILWKEGSSIYIQVALVGVDDSGRVLFFYHPDLVDVHELVAQVIGLGLRLTGLLYLDGGHHGSLYLDSAIGRGWNTRIALPNLLAVRATSAESAGTP